MVLDGLRQEVAYLRETQEQLHAESDRRHAMSSKADWTASRKQDPTHIFVLYSISFCITGLALLSGLAAYITCRVGHFYKIQGEIREDYANGYFGMSGVLSFLVINAFWTLFNLGYAFKGKQHRLWPINFAYDFFYWALIFGFGILRMINVLMDRGRCDVLGDGEEYDKCSIDLFILLVLELVCINLGLLDGVIHFIIMVGRCFTFARSSQRAEAYELHVEIDRERQALYELRAERQRLLEETEGRAARDAEPYSDEAALPISSSTAVPLTANGGEQTVSKSDVARRTDDLIDVDASSARGAQEATAQPRSDEGQGSQDTDAQAAEYHAPRSIGDA